MDIRPAGLIAVPLIVLCMLGALWSVLKGCVALALVGLLYYGGYRLLAWLDDREFTPRDGKTPDKVLPPPPINWETGVPPEKPPAQERWFEVVDDDLDER